MLRHKMSLSENFELELRTEADLEVTGSAEEKAFEMPENPSDLAPIAVTQTFQVIKHMASPLQNITAEVCADPTQVVVLLGLRNLNIDSSQRNLTSNMPCCLPVV